MHLLLLQLRSHYRKPETLKIPSQQEILCWTCFLHINRKPAVNIYPWRPSLITAPYEIGKKHKIKPVTPPRCAKTRQKTSWTLSTKMNLSHDTEVVFKVNAKVNYGFSIDGFFNFLIKLSTSWLCVILSHRKKLLVHLRIVKLKQVIVVYGTTIFVHS